MSNTASRRNSYTSEKPSASNGEKENSSQQKITDHNHASSSLMNLPDAKWIQIYINGDEHFSGCRCVVNSRYYRNLDMFLSYLTERLKPSFGAVRNIYTPVNGHPVNRLEDLISKHKYVVAGNERFKKLECGYSEVIDKKLKRTGWKPKNKYKVSKAKPSCHNTLNINIYQNGNFKAKPNKVSLLPQDLENWELVYRKVREILKSGPIKRLCSLNGKPIQNIEDLVSNHSYVVVGKHEIFKVGHYGIFSQKNSSSSKEKYLAHRSSRKSSVISAQSSGVYSQASARSSRLEFSSSANKNNHEDYHQHSAHNSLNISEPGNGFDSMASFNPPKIELPEEDDCEEKVRLDLDDDMSGIYRSKTQNHLTVGAVEIEDSPETVVDLPVDLLDAEEVEDEITPDMERSLQHLSLDVPDEIVAYLPSMQNKQNSDERQVSANKYNISHSQTLDIHNIFV